MKESEIVYKRVEQLYEEFKTYSELYTKKVKEAREEKFSKVKGKLDSMSEKHIRELAFETSAHFEIHRMDLSLLTAKFMNTYEVYMLMDLEKKHPEEIRATYNNLRNNSIRPVYTVNNDNQFEEIESGVVDRIKSNFDNTSLELLTKELEKQINTT